MLRMSHAIVSARYSAKILLRSHLAQEPLSVQGSGSGTPRKVVSTRKTSGPKRVVGRPPWPSFSFASILSSSPPFRLVLDWIKIFPSLLPILSSSPPFRLVLDWILFFHFNYQSNLLATI